MRLFTPRALRVSLMIAGLVEIALGFLHFFMPGQYRRSAGLAALEGVKRTLWCW